jgi:hypothetical protein
MFLIVRCLLVQQSLSNLSFLREGELLLVAGVAGTDDVADCGGLLLVVGVAGTDDDDDDCGGLLLVAVTDDEDDWVGSVVGKILKLGVKTSLQKFIIEYHSEVKRLALLLNAE